MAEVSADQPGFRLDDFLPYRLSVASNAASRLIATAYESRFGLGVPEWRLVVVLAEAGPLAQQAVVRRTGMDKVTVSRAGARLLDRRLVERRPSPIDGRSHELSLTEEGRRLYGEVIPMAVQFEAELLESLSDGERAQLASLLRRIEAAAVRLTGKDPGGG